MDSGEVAFTLCMIVLIAFLGGMAGGNCQTIMLRKRCTAVCHDDSVTVVEYDACRVKWCGVAE